MLTTPHAIVGAAIATQIPSPLVSLPLAFASHFILDMLPHWNPHLNTEIKKYGRVTTISKLTIYADTAIALASAILIARTFGETQTSQMIIMAGSLMGILPDVLEFPYFFLGMRDKFSKTILRIQKSIQTDVSFIPGVLSQVAVIASAILWIFRG